jgi:hypothetical protein
MVKSPINCVKPDIVFVRAYDRCRFGQLEHVDAHFRRRHKG